MEHIKDIMQLVGDRLASAAKSDVVVGQPLELGAVTVVPLSRVSIGVGAGGGSGHGDFSKTSKNPRHPATGKGEGGGTGGAAKVRPVGVVVFTADGVEVLSIPAKRGKLDKLFDSIPGLIEKVQKAAAKEG
jgi:uncharacterized spore protein YtfJ